jgi:SSS family solute:Na+ symporter
MKLISGQLYQYLQSVQAYISPPIAAVFLIGIFWKRVNSQGAIYSLITGFILGMGRLIAELNKDSLDGWLFHYADINFLHFAILLFIICSMVLVSVSLVTNSPSLVRLKGLTFATTDKKSKKMIDSMWQRNDIVLTVILLVCVGIIWIYFS